MGKGSRQRPGNDKRIGESYERMFGKRCVKHRKAECPICRPKEEPPEEEFYHD
jgi:hypothetical protein